MIESLLNLVHHHLWRHPPNLEHLHWPCWSPSTNRWEVWKTKKYIFLIGGIRWPILCYSPHNLQSLINHLWTQLLEHWTYDAINFYRAGTLDRFQKAKKGGVYTGSTYVWYIPVIQADVCVVPCSGYIDHYILGNLFGHLVFYIFGPLVPNIWSYGFYLFGLPVSVSPQTVPPQNVFIYLPKTKNLQRLSLA